MWTIKSFQNKKSTLAGAHIAASCASLFSSYGSLTAYREVTAPLIPPVGDTKTVTSSDIPRLSGNQHRVYLRWKPRQTPAKARMGGQQFQMTSA